MIPLTTAISGKCMDLPAKLFLGKESHKVTSVGQKMALSFSQSHGGKKTPNLKIVKSNQEIWK